MTKTKDRLLTTYVFNQRPLRVVNTKDSCTYFFKDDLVLILQENLKGVEEAYPPECIADFFNNMWKLQDKKRSILHENNHYDLISVISINEFFWDLGKSINDKLEEATAEEVHKVQEFLYKAK